MCLENKKGTFDVNIVFTATLTCTKRALLSQRGQFWSFEKVVEREHGPTVPPSFYTPVVDCISERRASDFEMSLRSIPPNPAGKLTPSAFIPPPPSPNLKMLRCPEYRGCNYQRLVRLVVILKRNENR